MELLYKQFLGWTAVAKMGIMPSGQPTPYHLCAHGGLCPANARAVRTDLLGL